MTTILRRLATKDFPECTRDALQYLVTTYSNRDPLPGLGGSDEDEAVQICQEYILFKSRKGWQKAEPQGMVCLSLLQKLNPIAELQLLEMLCTCFQDAEEKSKYHIFCLIFSAHADPVSNALLIKLLSLALSLGCSPVLDCVAIWMQDRGCDSKAVMSLTRTIVEDFCYLYPEGTKVLKELPKKSPLFVCNFVTAVTRIYTSSRVDNTPPLVLLELIAEWILADETLACESTRQAPIHGTSCSPVPGLAAWCTWDPLLCHLVLSTGPGNPEKRAERVHKVSWLHSRLHLGLLQSLQFCSTCMLPQPLLAMSDLVLISKSVQSLASGLSLPPDHEAIHAALERLAQLLQIAAQCGVLGVEQVHSQEMYSLVFKILPPNRTMMMVLTHNSTPQHPRK